MSIVTINDEHLTNIADAIRRKNGTENTYTPDKMADAIKDIQGDAKPVLREVMVFPKTEEMIITPGEDYDGISKVIVNPVTSDIDSDIKSANIKKGVNILGIDGTLEEGVTPSGTLAINSNGNYNVTNYANASVDVPSFEPTGEIEITVNGIYNVKDYASANVQIEGGASKFAPSFISFRGCNLTNIDYEIANIDAKNITSMARMFADCSAISVDLSAWDTSKVTTMSYMFDSSDVETISLRNLNTDSLTVVNYMFTLCKNLKEVDITGTRFQNVASYFRMFNGCDLLKTFKTDGMGSEKLTNISAMFYGCDELSSLVLKDFITTNVTNMSSMFYNCKSLKFLDIRSFDFSKVTNYATMFSSVPSNCEIIVKDDTAKAWMNSKFAGYTNVKTIAEYQAEGGV